MQNGSSESCESASTSSIGSNNSHNNTSKAPGAQLQHKNNSLYQNSLSNTNANGGKGTSINSNSISGFPDFAPDLRKQVNIHKHFLYHISPSQHYPFPTDLTQILLLL